MGQRGSGPQGSTSVDARDGGVVSHPKPKKSPVPDIQYKAPPKPNPTVQQKQVS